MNTSYNSTRDFLNKVKQLKQNHLNQYATKEKFEEKVTIDGNHFIDLITKIVSLAKNYTDSSVLENTNVFVFSDLNIVGAPEVKPTDIKRVSFKNCTISQMTASVSISFDNCKVGPTVFKLHKPTPAQNSITITNNSIIADFNCLPSGGNATQHITELRIENSQIENLKCNKVVFGRVTVNKTILGTTKPQLIDFNEAVFNETTSFEDCTFLSAHKFHGATLYSETSFTDSDFLEINKSSNENDYRVLKQHMKSISADSEVEKFQNLEVQSRVNRNKIKNNLLTRGNWIEYGCAWLLKEFNSFGQDLLKPVLWIIALIAFCFVTYYLPFFGLDIDEKKLPKWAELAKTSEHARSFIYSIKHGLGPLGLFFKTEGIVAASGMTKALAFFQFLISSVMLFIVVMQVRRRFRL